MSKESPSYEENGEFMSIAQKLSSRYPEMFGGIKIEQIACVSNTNKERGEGKGYYEINSVKPPVTMFCPKSYIIVVYAQDWQILPEKNKAALVASAISCISSKGEGKTVPFDMKDHSFILRTLGPDYVTNPNIPDILDDSVEWKR